MEEKSKPQSLSIESIKGQLALKVDMIIGILL